MYVLSPTNKRNPIANKDQSKPKEKLWSEEEQRLIDEHIAKIVAQAPPLSKETKERLAELLR